MPAIRNSHNADRICSLIADGYTLRQVAREIGCVASAITVWASEDEDFAARYARAMQLRTDRMAEEILDISDDGANDWMEREGVEVPDHEHMQRSKLRVDTRKWLMAKMMPKKYGDRVAVAGDSDAPLTVAVSVEDKRAAARKMLDEAFGKKPE